MTTLFVRWHFSHLVLLFSRVHKFENQIWRVEILQRIAFEIFLNFSNKNYLNSNNKKYRAQQVKNEKKLLESFLWSIYFNRTMIFYNSRSKKRLKFSFSFYHRTSYLDYISQPISLGDLTLLLTEYHKW